MKKKDWAKDELVEAIINFKEALVFIQHNKNMWLDIISESDKAISDISHFCEDNDVKSPHVKTVICRDLNKYGHTRRIYKNLYSLFKPLFSWHNNILMTDNFFNMCNGIKNDNDKINNNSSIYSYRILKHYENLLKKEKEGENGGRDKQ